MGGLAFNREELPEAAEKIVRKVLSGNVEKIFSDFGESLTVVITASGRTRHRPEYHFKITKGGKTLFYQESYFTKTRSRRNSDSVRNLQTIILHEAKEQFPELKEFLARNKGRVPDLRNFSFSLFDSVCDATDEEYLVDPGGFQLDEYEANGELVPEFMSLRDFVSRTDPEERQATFVRLVAMSLRTSIVKTADLRSGPKAILDPEDLLYEKEMMNVSGENLPKILHSLNQSDDPPTKGRFKEIVSQFKKITRMEVDVIVRPKQVKLPYRPTAEPAVYWGEGSGGIQPSGMENKTERIVRQELGIQVIKKGMPIPAGFASAGTIELLVLLTALVGQQNKIILLDEPASNLHPIMQRHVMDIVCRAVQKNCNQVVMITHSPFLVNSENFESTWRLSAAGGDTRAINLHAAIRPMRQSKQMTRRFYDTEVRGILFQRGVVLVEGPSDRIVLEKTDRHMTDNADPNAPNMEENEWAVLDVGGKDSMPLMINLAKGLGIPHAAILDHDALMECTAKIDIDGTEVRTSPVVRYVEQTEGLSDSEKADIQDMAKSISHTSENAQSAGTGQSWYEPRCVEILRKIALKHGMYVFTKDIEDVMRTKVTPKDSKPRADLDRINELLLAGEIPAEIVEAMKFIKCRIAKKMPSNR